MENNVKTNISKTIWLLWIIYAVYILIYKVALLGQLFNIVPAIIALIIALILYRRYFWDETRKYIRTSIIAAVILAMLFSRLNFVSAVYLSYIHRSDPLTAACYGLDMDYLQRTYHRGNTDEFPEKLPQDADDCSLTFMPSVLQGSGFLCVSFKTSEKEIDNYLDKFAPLAILPVFTVAEYKGDAQSEVLQNLSDYCEATELRDLDLYIPGDLQKNCPNAEIYLIRSNFDWNHPHSFCFCCDKASGTVVFSEIG